MKTIICDLDMTLCESRQPISLDMGKLINNLAEKYYFVIITGGRFERLETQVFPYIDCKIYCFSSLGSKYCIYDYGKIIKIFDWILTKDHEFAVFNLVKKFMATQKIKVKSSNVENKGGLLTYSVTGKDAPLEIKKKFDPDGNKRKTWVKKIKEWLPSDLDVKVGGTTSLDFFKKGMGKGFAIKYFLNEYKLEKRDVLYIGDSIFDGGNDEEVIGLVPYIKVRNPTDTYSILKDIYSKEGGDKL